MRVVAILAVFACSNGSGPRVEAVGRPPIADAAVAQGAPIDANAASRDAGTIDSGSSQVDTERVVDDAADPSGVDCTETCTEYAVCWERVNKGRDYHEGSRCVHECEHRTIVDRRQWAAAVHTAFTKKRCKGVVGSDD